MPMGPVELADTVGLDIIANVGDPGPDAGGRQQGRPDGGGRQARQEIG
jgi:3-hydroxyacyl-CoA dehydrogenase